MFLWGATLEKAELTKEDLDCLRDWENYTLLNKLPHELGYTEHPSHEDIEAIKTMKKWSEQRQERERKKEESRKRMQERMRRGGGGGGGAGGAGKRS